MFGAVVLPKSDKQGKWLSSLWKRAQRENQSPSLFAFPFSLLEMNYKLGGLSREAKKWGFKFQKALILQVCKIKTNRDGRMFASISGSRKDQPKQIGRWQLLSPVSTNKQFCPMQYWIPLAYCSSFKWIFPFKWFRQQHVSANLYWDIHLSSPVSVSILILENLSEHPETENITWCSFASSVVWW